VFVESLWSPVSELSVSAATRLDLPERFGPEASPRVGIGYTLTRTGTQLRAAWGQGFKLPSLFTLGDSRYWRPLSGTVSTISSISARNHLPSSTAPKSELRASKPVSP
jgi:outer membrane receptor for ferrienterochelin and colicin